MPFLLWSAARATDPPQLIKPLERKWDIRCQGAHLAGGPVSRVEHERNLKVSAPVARPISSYFKDIADLTEVDCSLISPSLGYRSPSVL